jgi:hypothetical protein
MVVRVAEIIAAALSRGWESSNAFVMLAAAMRL